MALLFVLIVHNITTNWNTIIQRKKPPRGMSPRVGRAQLYRLSLVDAHTVAQNYSTRETNDMCDPTWYW